MCNKFPLFKRGGGGGARKVLPCQRAQKVSDPRFSHFVANIGTYKIINSIWLCHSS